jgi:hypothetical protein
MRPIEVEMVMSKIRKHELDHEPDIPRLRGFPPLNAAWNCT